MGLEPGSVTSRVFLLAARLNLKENPDTQKKLTKPEANK